MSTLSDDPVPQPPNPWRGLVEVTDRIIAKRGTRVPPADFAPDGAVSVARLYEQSPLVRDAVDWCGERIADGQAVTQDHYEAATGIQPRDLYNQLHRLGTSWRAVKAEAQRRARH